MKKQPKITAATKQNLITAFWELYEKKNIEQIGIKDITDLAGYHRATFYEYFTDIYDVLNQEENDLIQQIEKADFARLQANGMKGMLEQIADFYMKNGKRLNLLIGVGGDSEFFSKFKNALYPIFRVSRELPDTAAFSLIYEFGISGLLMAFHSWYQSSPRLSVEDFIKIARSLIERGVPHTIVLAKTDDMIHLP